MELIYVDDSSLGVTRKQKNKQWQYFDPIGKIIEENAIIERLNSLTFPPAYKSVWFCSEENRHILATGTTVNDENSTGIIHYLHNNKMLKNIKFVVCLSISCRYLELN
ncbi:DNA topoisomerase I [Pseudoalteromonas sp. BSi20652]|nr:DNA topoisomerase I [Pseudoalteromonas sp. BSi20652]